MVNERMAIAPDMAYRPESYWDTPDAILARIKGEQRRELIRTALEGGDAERLPTWILKDELDEEERRHLGQIHPLFMGGEYLPRYGHEEVEIARAALQSTTGDVISVRARRVDGMIHYSVVDEYESRFQCSPSRSPSPLTLGELVSLIDSARNTSTGYVGLTAVFRDVNLKWGSDAEELVDFVRVSSPFYPRLSEHYEAEGRAWLQAIRERETEETTRG
jgi:hypothetical protein